MAKKKRRRNKRVRIHTAKFDRCVKAVSRRKGKRRAKSPAAVCQAHLGKRAILKRHRRKRNASPRSGFVLMVRKPGKGRRPFLWYTGRYFTNEKAKGPPFIFRTIAQARLMAQNLRIKHPMLNAWEFHTNLARIKNPSPRVEAEVDKAAAAQERFSGHRARRVLRKRLPRAAFTVGRVRYIEYDAKKDGEWATYWHPFKGSMPTLAAGNDGHTVLILDTKFADGGFE